jgi:4-amino-4-deoxy-L-arabinose transferase-like glycosyltransferase
VISGIINSGLIIYLVGLGNLPLRDWDEATIAQVAKEISQTPLEQLRWLFPSLWGRSLPE